MHPSPTTPLGRAWQRVADRESARIRDVFLREPAPAIPVRAWLGQGLAVLVVAGYVALVALGLYGALRVLGLVGNVPGFQRFVLSLPVLLALLFAWIARPRFGALDGQEVRQGEAPELHALVRRVADELGVQDTPRLRLFAEVNAYMGPEGWRRTPTLGLGLGLWYGLHPQERVAILAHELAHLKNADPTRGGVVGLALNVLGHAVHVLTPDGWMQANAEGMGYFYQWLMRLSALLPLGLYSLILNLVGADHQAAEYRADRMASRVAGSAATASALDKLHLGGLLESALHKQRHMPERPHAFAELRAMWDAVTPEGWARAREDRARQGARLDDSHPPTAHRLQVVEAWPQPPTVALTPEAAARIDAELLPFVAPLERAAYDDYRERHGI